MLSSVSVLCSFYFNSILAFFEYYFDTFGHIQWLLVPFRNLPLYLVTSCCYNAVDLVDLHITDEAVNSYVCLKQAALWLFGHIVCSGSNEDHSRALNAGIDNPPKEWRRPRPHQTWLRTIENDLKQNLGLWSARHKAYDQEQWREIVEAATLLQGHATWWWWWSCSVCVLKCCWWCNDVTFAASCEAVIIVGHCSCWRRRRLWKSVWMRWCHISVMRRRKQSSWLR